ncbi:MAG: ATP-binding protein [Bryobacteraceae bacterium]
MTRSAHADCEMRVTLPATLQAVEEFFAEFRRKSQSLPDPSICFGAELLVREALTNAVLHGSGADPAKQVRCSVRLKGRRLLIAVSDDGEGFDWRAARHKPAGSLDISGRGIGILHQYANWVRYNERGNVVTMIKRFDEEKPMVDILREDNKAVLRPGGDNIVAATLPDLRAKMRAIVEEGVQELVIDLTDVRMVDSSGIGLLISAHNSLRKSGGTLAVIHASAEILELFRTMRMHQHFSVSGN